MLILCILISQVIHRRAMRDRGHSPERATDAPLGKTGAFQLLMNDRYLMLIAILTVLLNIVNTNGEYLLDKFLITEATRAVGTEVAAQKVFMTQFKGDFQSAYSLLGMLLQMFAVSRIFKHVGVRGALFVLPCIALGSYSAFLFLPVLGVVKWAKIAENGTDYSVQNTTRQALFLPCSREAKYKAKAAIDTFFQRAGDVLSSGVVYVRTLFAFSVTSVAAVNLILTLAWLAIAVGIAREHRKRSTEEPAALGSEPAVAQGNIA
jgi:AAA family ATP:ADP antiporter